MPVEAAQILCTTHWINKLVGHVPRRLTSAEWQVIKDAKRLGRVFPYLPVMHNHPCTVWARKSQGNYRWLYDYAKALNDEYKFRYKKDHKSFVNVICQLPAFNIPVKNRTEHVQVVPDEFKQSDAVQAYRNYYLKNKFSIAKWTRRETPEWWKID